MAAYKRRRIRELREMASAMSYANHAPEKIAENLIDPSELQEKAAAAGFETDNEVYWKTD